MHDTNLGYKEYRFRQLFEVILFIKNIPKNLNFR